MVTPIPVRPEAPLPSDCCGNGCSPCVWDTYAEALAEWERVAARDPDDPPRAGAGA